MVLRACCNYTSFSALVRLPRSCTETQNCSQNCKILQSKTGTSSFGSLTPLPSTVASRRLNLREQSKSNPLSLECWVSNSSSSLGPLCEISLVVCSWCKGKAIRWGWYCFICSPFQTRDLAWSNQSSLEKIGIVLSRTTCSASRASSPSANQDSYVQ